MHPKIKKALQYICCVSNTTDEPVKMRKEEGTFNGTSVRPALRTALSDSAISNIGEIYLGGEIDPDLYRVLDRATPQGNS